MPNSQNYDARSEALRGFHPPACTCHECGDWRLPGRPMASHFVSDADIVGCPDCGTSVRVAELSRHSSERCLSNKKAASLAVTKNELRDLKPCPVAPTAV